MDYIFGDFFDGYAQSIDVKDMNRILEYFNYPCLIISGKQTTACKNKEELEDLYKNKFRYLAARLGLVTSYSVASLLYLDDTNLIVSLLWRTVDRGGAEISRSHCNYHLIQKDGFYKIVVAMLPQEGD